MRLQPVPKVEAPTVPTVKKPPKVQKPLVPKAPKP